MAGKLMQAVQYDGYGGGAAGLKHVELPVPSPKKEEVLIKLEASSINPFDWKIQKGVACPFLPRKFPIVPVTDVAGEVVEVGQGLNNIKVGDKVVAMLNTLVLYTLFRILSHTQKKKKKKGNKEGQNGGGLAEYAVAPVKLTVKRPPEVSAAEGAGLPIAGLTALQALTNASGIKLNSSGKQSNILITAASGGVGHYAVQLAKLSNTHVTATCGARNIEFVKSLGADEVLDYQTLEGSALKSPSGRKYDSVIQCTTGIPWFTFEPNLTENGKVVDLTPGLGPLMTFALNKLIFSKKTLVPLLVSPKGENLEYLVGLVKEGKLKTLINSRHPLRQAEDAWAKSIEGHATGKIIVEP